jgi:hypothetical protein
MQAHHSKQGIVLFAVLTTVAALALLAGTISILAVTDIRMAARFKRTVDALYSADAGSQYVKACIQAELRAGTLGLDRNVETVCYTAPTGMTFDTVNQLRRTADTNVFFFQVTGRAHDARCDVEVAFKRGSVFDLGLFGDEEVDTKAFGGIYVYDSGETPAPTPADSIGGATLASNGDFLTYQDTYIDGSFDLGADPSGTPARWRETPSGGSIITGEPAIPVDRIDPDPLGAQGGDLANDFLFYSVGSNNNNANAVPPISAPQNRVLLNNGSSMLLPSGNYYVSEITIRNGARLDVDTTSGPVNIYLTGKLEAKEGSIINVTGLPPDLRIYSNSDDPINIKHEGAFSGLIYAPYAYIGIRNTGDFYGVAWGRSLETKNSGEIYIDISLRNAFPNNKVKLLSWKELRD